MLKRVIALFFIVVLVAIHHTALAGEELMPMHAGAYAEVGPESGTQVYRVVSTQQRLKMPDRKQMHRNQVKLKLPSLGPPVESRVQMIEVNESSSDGSLNFSQGRPAAPESLIGIPGMVSPEELAMDVQNRREYALPDPSLLAELPVLSAMPSPAFQPEEIQAMAPAEPITFEPEMRRRDSLNNPKRPRSSYSRIEIPANATTVVKIPQSSTVVSLPARSEPIMFEPRAVELPPPLTLPRPYSQLPAEATRFSGSGMPPVEAWDLEPRRVGRAF